MLISNTPQIPTYRIVDNVGPVIDVAVHSQDVIETIFGGMQIGIGGNFASHTALTEAARDAAHSRLCANAYQIGGNVIAGMRYSLVEVVCGVIEVLA